MSSERSQVSNATLSFPDRLGEVELGKPGCGQGMRREEGVGSNASGCFWKVISSTFLLGWLHGPNAFASNALYFPNTDFRLI